MADKVTGKVGGEDLTSMPKTAKTSKVKTPGFGGGDPADTAAASYCRHPVEDLELPDSPEYFQACFQEALAQALRLSPALPRTLDELRAVLLCTLGLALKRLDVDDFKSRQRLDATTALAEILQRFTSVENGRLYAHCYLLVINRSPYSEVQIASLLGVEKQAVSKVKTMLQDQLGLSPRVGRSDASRQKFREICLARAARKRNVPAAWPWRQRFVEGLAA